MRSVRVFGCRCFAGAASPATHICTPSLSRRTVLEGLAGVISVAALAGTASAQELRKVSLKNACRFDGRSGANTVDVNLFDPVEDGTRVVAKIAESIGLQPNFHVLQAKISNAVAVIYDHMRYILYDKDFVKGIEAKAETQWTVWTIMAHEMGHHLNGHTLLEGGSQPQLELEADHFAGFVVRRLGATLEQTKLLYEQLPAEASDTHPGRVTREAEVAAGWEQGGFSMRDIVELPLNRVAASELLQGIIQKMQMGQVPDAPMAPTLQQTIPRQSQRASAQLQPRGKLVGVQVASIQQLPSGNFLYRFQAQFAGGPMDWRLWLKPGGTLTGLQYQ
jgi:hypothetical protein